MQTIIIAFLIGAVASLAFRVWALIPLTLIILAAADCFRLHQGLPALSAFGDALLAALAPQLGYALGLAIAGVVLALRAPRRDKRAHDRHVFGGPSPQ